MQDVFERQHFELGGCATFDDVYEACGNEKVWHRQEHSGDSPLDAGARARCMSRIWVGMYLTEKSGLNAPEPEQKDHDFVPLHRTISPSETVR